MYPIHPNANPRNPRIILDSLFSRTPTCHQLSGPIKSPFKHFSNPSILYPHYEHLFYLTIISRSTNLLSTLQTELFLMQIWSVTSLYKNPSVTSHYPGIFQILQHTTVTLDASLCISCSLSQTLSLPSSFPQYHQTNLYSSRWSVLKHYFFSWWLLTTSQKNKFILRVYVSIAPCTLPLVTHVSSVTYYI